MKLSGSGNRPKSEQRCVFAIVGNSSKLDQDEGDFDDDFFGGKTFGAQDNNATCPIDNLEHETLMQARIISEPKNKRYVKEWSQPDTVGFAIARVTLDSFELT